MSGDLHAQPNEPLPRPLHEIVHDMVNSAMAIDLYLGVMEVREPSDSVRSLRVPANDLLDLIRELDALVTPEVNP